MPGLRDTKLIQTMDSLANDFGHLKKKTQNLSDEHLTFLQYQLDLLTFFLKKMTLADGIELKEE